MDPLPSSETLQLGTSLYTLRPLNASDKGRLQNFFYSHTPDTIRNRYGYRLTEMTPQRASQLVGVDQLNDVALGIFEGRDDTVMLHAVGRYFSDREDKSAECAFVVRESKRKLGMGSLLLERLITIARARGLHKLWAQVAASNYAMLSVFSKFGATIKSQEDTTIVYVAIDLHTPMAQE